MLVGRCTNVIVSKHCVAIGTCGAIATGVATPVVHVFNDICCSVVRGFRGVSDLHVELTHI